MLNSTSRRFNISNISRNHVGMSWLLSLFLLVSQFCSSQILLLFDREFRRTHLISLHSSFTIKVRYNRRITKNIWFDNISHVVISLHPMCVCVCVCVFMWFMRTHICVITWVWQRCYNLKVLYENTFVVPVIQKAYKSYRMSFFENLNMHKFWCRAIENMVCTV